MKKRNGAALIMVVTLSSLLLLAAIGVSMNAVSNINITSDDRIKTRLEFACMSGIKRAKAKIEESYNNKNLTILEPEITFQGWVSDDTGLLPEEKIYGDESFENGANIDYYSYTYHSYEDNRDITVKYAIKSLENWQKSQNHTSSKLNIEAVAYSSGYGWVGMTENIIARRTTLFMYQVFFENDLEILPGPNFNLTGLIHTNENLYLNANNTLNVYTDSLTAAGEAFRGRLDRNEATGTVKITSDNEDGTLTTMNIGTDDATNDDWADIASSKWKGSFRDKNLGATRLEAPKLESFEPGGYYDNAADLKISVIADGYSLSGTKYSITLNGSTAVYTSSDLSGALKEVEMYDRREYGTSRKIRTTEVDVQKLSTILGYPDNGIIYMTRDDAAADADGNPYVPDSSRNVSGFKLKNASALPDATTFVSNLPTYIQGNFNVHTSSDPDADSWKPCAVVADSINLLSNNWKDSLSNTSQTASNTEYNMVFITGNVPTKSGQYSGGLENFPRFLENWNGKTTTISGGFIQLFRSKYATGLWDGSYYSPPVRNWGSEERFNDLTNLPPGYANLFPSTNLGMAYSNWSLINKSEALISDDE
jgi:hypothetical protein